MPDANPDRPVPVRAERYEALLDVVSAAIKEHSLPIVKGGHGLPPRRDCSLCVALSRLIGPDGPEVGPDERAYLDELHPRPAGEGAR